MMYEIEEHKYCYICEEIPINGKTIRIGRDCYDIAGEEHDG